jgi:RNA polymerase sigma factor (sigma-70 family)
LEKTLSKPDIKVAGNKDNISIDDSMLVRLCQGGDIQATERLIVKYQDRIYNVIFKIVGNSDDAAELTQETFVKVIEKVTSFKAKSSFYTWLFRVAVNTALNFCRKRFKITTQSIDACINDENADSARKLSDFLKDEKEPDPAQIAQNAETGEIILKALAKLQDDHRAVIVLRDIESMTYEEIAKTLKIELGTVKSRICRARAELREILSQVLP